MNDKQFHDMCEKKLAKKAQMDWLTALCAWAQEVREKARVRKSLATR